MVLMSMSHIKALLIVLPAQSAVTLAAQWHLAPRFGEQGITLALVAAYLLTSAWALPWFSVAYLKAGEQS